MVEFNSLPFELFERILNFVDGYTLFKCRTVCGHWKNIIDENEKLWREKCIEEFKFSSQIAKRKCGNEMKWYQLYRNLKKWPQYSTSDRILRKFYHFTTHDKCHALDIGYSILPLRESQGIILYDMKTLKYVPVAVPERNCQKISNSEIATVIQVKSGIYLQRSVKDKRFETEAFFKADKFVLLDETLYFFNNRDIYKCDLKLHNLKAELIHHSNYDLWELQYSHGLLHVFTDCGKILSIDSKNNIKENAINCPEEWIRSVKHICPLDNENYICYSRNLFMIQMGSHRHLYLDFPIVTALFFYGDIVLIGTKAGEILLYRMSSQKKAKPVFEKLTVLPEGKFAVTLDVYERKTGPMIVASSFFDMFIYEIKLFPEEESPAKKGEFASKVEMYKRLLKLKERVRNS